jgi:hypothetical protein
MTMSTGDPQGKFGPNCKAQSESIAEFVARSRLTPEEIAWTQSQPVHGRPDLDRLRAELAKAGFEDIEIEPSADRERLSFRMRLTERVVAEDNDALLRSWITALRSAGFRVGFEEVGVADVEGNFISADALTAPLEEICEQGAPHVRS